MPDLQLSLAAGKTRFDDELAFVLHTYPYKETSLIVEVFSRRHGRFPLVARGARRPRSAMRGLLQAFQPLHLGWFGKSELRTLHAAEWQGGGTALGGLGLLCGLYLNELVLKLIPRDDPHEKLFAAYAEALARLAAPARTGAILRGFEKCLLEEAGFAPILDRDAETGSPIAADRAYWYVPDRGALNHGDCGGVPVRGKALLDLASADFSKSDSQLQIKQLLRALIEYHLDGEELQTRQLLKDLHAL